MKAQFPLLYDTHLLNDQKACPEIGIRVKVKSFTIRAERLIAFAIKSRYDKTRFPNRNVRDL